MFRPFTRNTLLFLFGLDQVYFIIINVKKCLVSGNTIGPEGLPETFWGLVTLYFLGLLASVIFFNFYDSRFSY